MVSGRRFRVLNIVDDVTRECLAAIPDTSICGRRVVRELALLIERRGKPGLIVSDNGTELTSNAVLSWCGQTGVEWHYIAPGRPMQNGFNGRMRDELLTRPCSSAWITPAGKSPRGWRTKIGTGRIRRSAIKPRRTSPPNCTRNGLLRYALRAPLRRPLLPPRLCATKSPDFNPRWRKARSHVRGIFRDRVSEQPGQNAVRFRWHFPDAAFWCVI